MNGDGSTAKIREIAACDGLLFVVIQTLNTLLKKENEEIIRGDSSILYRMLGCLQWSCENGISKSLLDQHTTNDYFLYLWYFKYCLRFHKMSLCFFLFFSSVSWTNYGGCTRCFNFSWWCFCSIWWYFSLFRSSHSWSSSPRWYLSLFVPFSFPLWDVGFFRL